VTLYSSREPFNDDPYPYQSIQSASIGLDYRVNEASLLSRPEQRQGYALKPRPEYDRPQNNPTNPILTEFRRLVNETGNGLYVTAWLFSGDLLEEWESYPLEQWHHAMDVLQKILSIYKKADA
jgi:hypothetical protein